MSWDQYIFSAFLKADSVALVSAKMPNGFSSNFQTSRAIIKQ